MIALVPLDPEEAAEIPEILAREEAERQPSTDVRIYRTARYLPHIFAIVLAAIVWRLGSVIGALAIVAVLAGFVIAWPRRVARYRYDDEGRLFVGDARTPLDWDRIAEIRVWYSTWTNRWGFSTLEIRMTLAGGSVLRFARGNHFHATGPRRPVTGGAFERWLERRARQAGMKVERTRGEGWTASRP